MLWRAEEINTLVGSKSNGRPNLAGVTVNGVQIDSRSVKPGDLFIPLAPPLGVRDGHDFIDEAFKRGAVAALSSKPSTQRRVIEVTNTFDALVTLGRAARRRLGSQARVIAITGSSGKTTLRSWLEHVISAFDETHASEGSFNNHLGVPLSLSRMPSSTRYGVFEVGTNHPGEIGPLSDHIEPDIAIVLNVLPVHIGNFDGIADLRAEKLSIRSGLKPDGTLMIERNLAGHVDGQTRTFDAESSANVSVCASEIGGDLRANIDGQAFPIELPASGVHLQATAAACLAVVDQLGLDVPAAIHRLRSAPIPKGRGNRRDIEGITLIDESYNANPDSMRLALTTLREQEAGRIHLILGEMHELGDFSLTAHQNVLDWAKGFYRCFTIGPEFAASALDRGLPHYESSDAFDIEAFVEHLGHGDTVMVKGSNKVFWVKQFVPRLEAALQRRATG